MSHRQTPKCLNCALVNEVDRQLPVSPRAGRALPPALLRGLPRVPGTLQVRSPSLLCPSLALAPSFTLVPNSTVPALEGMEPILRSTQERKVGCGRCWPGAVQTGRWGWQLASGSRPHAGQSLEIHTCKGGLARGDAGKDKGGRQEARDWREAQVPRQSSTAVGIRGMFIAHLLCACTERKALTHLILCNPHSAPAWSVSPFTDKNTVAKREGTLSRSHIHSSRS